MFTFLTYIPFLISITLSSLFPAPESPEIPVQIIGLNDLHGQINSTTPLHGKPAGRADYIASYINAYKQQFPHTLLVHTGDMIGGSPPISALFQDEPTIEFLNMLQFDVGTIGNHEFDEGVEELKRLIDGGFHPKTGMFPGSSFPYVCANVLNANTNKPLFPPYVIKWIDGIPIAFIGVVTKETPFLTMQGDMSAVTFIDEATAVQTYVRELQQKGIHAIIVLAHLDGKTTDRITYGPLADLASKLDDDVDILFGGHNHSYMNGFVNGKLLVEAYSYGKAFANVQLTLNRKTKDITRKTAKIIPTYHDQIQPNLIVQTWLQSYQTKVAPLTEQILGKSIHEVTRDQNKNGEADLGALIAVSQRQAMQTDIAFVNPGTIRHNLPAGFITWENTFLIQPFENKLIKMELTGKEIQSVLHEQWDDEVRMLQVSGICYTWEKNEVKSISLENGEPLQDDTTYSVVVNSFLANGGDKFTIFQKGRNRVEGPTDQEAFANFIRSTPSLENIRVNHIQKIQ
ncbi:MULTISPECIES: bifunctional metallophosphatase/5'-nucleotidase [unclassified Bacillus (in: firmicutes)]|uniref:bifunctional metallophosphatase/5'-nucleotidase n=1 Tax=unclassified Bacillus (in: firmicutes) TaxID=185979 RepID=UPI00232EAAC8|nr:bifunctional metallophosphatase/5'-nucleotidase [Bacillus sp. BP-3]MDC2866006.1 bifunctional metallophosphatase/5'-nucleotidase [Bacillus sp. BP-3]